MKNYLMFLLIALLCGLFLALTACDDGGGDDDSEYTDFITVSIDGVLKEFTPTTSASVLGATQINGQIDGDEGQEVLLIMVPDTDIGAYDLDSGVTVTYMGPDGTYIANAEAKEYGADFVVHIDEFADYAAGTFSGYLVRANPAGGYFTIEFENGEFNISVNPLARIDP